MLSQYQLLKKSAGRKLLDELQDDRKIFFMWAK